ncbi:MAG: hypothetical protein AUJ92_03625 [Armatimonadetes bacterium CG2_30_59_28]|nr:MAG: hypothetical protein AUJ92_03625 [Armatimonadetes bacterium CG2_30_59_28]
MAIRSFFGVFVRGLEDPDRMLQQYMDDMRSQVPKMNDTVAEVMKNEYMTKNQVERLEKKVTDLDAQIIAAIKLGPEYEEEAKTLISAVETAREDLEDTRQQYNLAKAASEKARDARDDFMRTMNQKIQEAMRAINKSKQAKMQEQLAGLMTSFEIGDQTDILDRMTEKIDERAARAQARVELATSGVDSKLNDIKKASARIGVDEKLLEYKRQLGMAPEEAGDEKTMEPVAPPQRTLEAANSDSEATEPGSDQPTMQPQQQTGTQ